MVGAVSKVERDVACNVSTPRGLTIFPGGLSKKPSPTPPGKGKET